MCLCVCKLGIGSLNSPYETSFAKVESNAFILYPLGPLEISSRVYFEKYLSLITDEIFLK